MKAKDVVVIAIALLLVLGAYVSFEPSMSRGPVMVPEDSTGSGGIGGWSDSSLSGTILSPMHLHPEMNNPLTWLISWFGGLLVGHAADPLLNCVTGPTGTCTTTEGPVGGGGGGGIPGDNGGAGGGGGWARKANLWDWFAFLQNNKK